MEHFKAAGLRFEWIVDEGHRFRAICNGGQIKSQRSPIVIFRKEPKGRLILNHVLEDVLRFDGVDKTLHPWQQSLATSSSLVRSLSRPGDLVSDLFVRSGIVPAAVALTGEGRRFAGCEIDANLGESCQSASCRGSRSPTVGVRSGVGDGLTPLRGTLRFFSEGTRGTPKALR
jgi:hypothetical protein